jgi:hypothetical protein
LAASKREKATLTSSLTAANAKLQQKDTLIGQQQQSLTLLQASEKELKDQLKESQLWHNGHAYEAHYETPPPPHYNVSLPPHYTVPYAVPPMHYAEYEPYYSATPPAFPSTPHAYQPPRVKEIKRESPFPAICDRVTKRAKGSFCPQCGDAVIPDAKFCQNCAAQL